MECDSTIFHRHLVTAHFDADDLAAPTKVQAALFLNYDDNKKYHNLLQILKAVPPQFQCEADTHASSIHYKYPGLASVQNLAASERDTT